DAGTYFPSVKRDPGRYLQPCSDSVKTWLRSMKNAGKVLLLITSSHSDYCRLICEHILGKDFEELFDVIITNALKPGFFSLVPQQRPFRTLEHRGFVGESEDVLLLLNQLKGCCLSRRALTFFKADPQVIPGEQQATFNCSSSVEYASQHLLPV
ncbi:5'-nucleotidase domain-containing protein 1, partial [Nibea albiflora]